MTNFNKLIANFREKWELRTTECGELVDDPDGDKCYKKMYTYYDSNNVVPGLLDPMFLSPE